MTHKELVDIAYKWVLNNAHCGVAFKELVTTAMETPDVLGFGGNRYSVLIECKASRADFLKDKQKPFRAKPELGMGKLRYYCCPTGLIKPDELPDKWGLIYVNEKGRARKVKKVHPTKGYWADIGFTERNFAAEQNFMYSALRRLHYRGAIEPNIYSQKTK